MVPAEYLANNLGLMLLPDYMVLICLAVVMMPFSWLGVSPIMMAVFFGSLLGSLPVLPVDPTLAALAISCGWAPINDDFTLCDRCADGVFVKW